VCQCHQDGDDEHDEKVENGDGGGGLESPEGLVFDQLGLEREVLQGDQHDDRRILDHLDVLSSQGWNDDAQRLRHKDVLEDLGTAVPAGQCGFGLPRRDGPQARRYDVGDVGALVKDEGQDAGGDCVKSEDKVQEEQLDDDGDVPHRLDVGAGGASQKERRQRPQAPNDDADDGAADDRDGRKPDR